MRWLLAAPLLAGCCGQAYTYRIKFVPEIAVKTASTPSGTVDWQAIGILVLCLVALVAIIAVASRRRQKT